MGTIAEKLNKILQSKEEIRIAINNKGGTITESDKFSDYATAIDNLVGGGSVDLLKPILTEGKAPVPNTGYVEKIFFNTKLTTDEVDSLIANANLPFVNFEEDITIYPLLVCDKNFIVIANFSSGLDTGKGSA